MTLSLGTAYRSFGGEVEASSTPTICRLPDSRRHQLWAIAHRGGPWRKNVIGALLRNEAYIGNFIYKRDTEKLGAKRTHNPRELWIRSEGTIEPIIERDVFLRAKKTMEERRVCITEEEMLVRLRKVLMKKGELSATIIDASPSLPSVSAYLLHFGTLRNVYRLIGY